MRLVDVCLARYCVGHWRASVSDSNVCKRRIALQADGGCGSSEQ